jgi:hypothetical protein
MAASVSFDFFLRPHYMRHHPILLVTALGADSCT